MFKEQRQSSKLLKSKSFDICKNSTVPMIVMLDHSEIDIEVSDAGMETADFNNCREMSRDDRDINSMLATTQKGIRFSHKDR